MLIIAEMRKHPGGGVLHLGTFAAVPTQELCAVGLDKKWRAKNVEAERFLGDSVTEPLMNAHRKLIERSPVGIGTTRCAEVGKGPPEREAYYAPLAFPRRAEAGDMAQESGTRGEGFIESELYLTFSGAINSNT